MTNPRMALTDYERSLRMSRTQSPNKSGGITFASALGLLFIGLKLGHVITWPWIWVLAPFWLGTALVLLFVVVCGLIIGLAEIGKQRRR